MQWLASAIRTVLPARRQARREISAASFSGPPSLRREGPGVRRRRAGPDDREGRGKIAPRRKAELVGPAGDCRARSRVRRVALEEARWAPSIKGCLKSWSAP